MSIYQRIGEAIASQGKVTLIAAMTPDEEHILTTSGFKKVGTMDIDGNAINVFEVKITQIINTPVSVQQPNVYPGTKQFPYGGQDNTGPIPRKYEEQWPETYRLGKGENSVHDKFTYRGNQVNLNNAYNPLSILEDYFFPSTDGRGSVVESIPERRVFKIDVDSDITAEQISSFKNKVHEYYQQAEKNRRQ